MATVNPDSRPCPACGTPLLWAVDDAGTRRGLDPTPRTWVVIGTAKDGTPQVRRSRGYVEHVGTCPQGTQGGGNAEQ